MIDFYWYRSSSLLICTCRLVLFVCYLSKQIARLMQPTMEQKFNKGEWNVIFVLDSFFCCQRQLNVIDFDLLAEI